MMFPRKNEIYIVFKWDIISDKMLKKNQIEQTNLLEKLNVSSVASDVPIVLLVSSRQCLIVS